jgi:WD40 repeat protein
VGLSDWETCVETTSATHALSFSLHLCWTPATFRARLTCHRKRPRLRHGPGNKSRASTLPTHHHQFFSASRTRMLTVVRSLSGHKANIRSVDFHPYGDFIASGSLDTVLKVWDIRRKGCIQQCVGSKSVLPSPRFRPLLPSACRPCSPRWRSVVDARADLLTSPGCFRSPRLAKA